MTGPPTANATLSTTGGCRKASPARPNGRASPKNPQLIQPLSTAKLPRFPTLSTKLSTGQEWRPWRSSPLSADRFSTSGAGQELSGGVSCAWTRHSPASHAMEGDPAAPGCTARTVGARGQTCLTAEISVGPRCQASAMRPALKSGLLPVWRDRDTLQIGIDPRRAIALSGMRQAAFVVGLLDGSRERDQVIAAAAGRGISAQATERILSLLAAAGALDDFPASTLRDIPPALRARLAPELATTSLAHRDGDGGARSLARRQVSVVRIEGEQRIGRGVARILSAAGVGRIEFVRPQPESAGWPSEQPDQNDVADLVILVGRQPIRRLAQLRGNRVPHLAVAASEAIGVVGPMVVPKRTACLLCMEFVRAGNDSAWPLILAQLGRRRPDPPACDAVLAAAVAAQAAAQGLIAIDQNPLASAAVNGTLELVLPDWKWRRRTWPLHPACPCSVTPPDNRQ